MSRFDIHLKSGSIDGNAPEAYLHHYRTEEIECVIESKTKRELSREEIDDLIMGQLDEQAWLDHDENDPESWDYGL